MPLLATPSEAALRAAHARVLTALTGEETTADDDIAVAISGDGALLLRYRTDVLDAAAAARIAGYHVAALAGEPLLSAEELRFQLEGLAGPRRALPDRRFHELFEQRVAEHPDAVAAVQGDRQWTYRELNARANRLGRALLARGLRPEGRRRGRDRAQPRLDGRGHRDLQGRRRVPADRAALPGRPHRDDARARGLPARARRDPRSSGRTRRTTTTPTSASRSPRTGSPTSTSPPAPRASRRARCASTRACSTTSSPRSTTWRSARGRWSPRPRRSASTSRSGSWSPRSSSAGGR